MSSQIVGDDTLAIDSVLQADVWRDHLLKEEVTLNAQLAALEAEGDDKRFEDAREEASVRLAEVHARLSDMDAESGPARAAALLAGRSFSSFGSGFELKHISGLGFNEADQQRQTRSFSGGWRCDFLFTINLMALTLHQLQDATCVGASSVR